MKICLLASGSWMVHWWHRWHSLAAAESNHCGFVVTGCCRIWVICACRKWRASFGKLLLLESYTCCICWYWLWLLASTKLWSTTLQCDQKSKKTETLFYVLSLALWCIIKANLDPHGSSIPPVCNCSAETVFLPLHHLVDCVWYRGTAPLMNFCKDGITSGLLADVTMIMVTLAVEHGQMSPGYLVTSQNKISHPGATDITIIMVTLTAQYKCLAQIL